MTVTPEDYMAAASKGPNKLDLVYDILIDLYMKYYTTSEKINITESAEDKLKQIIGFIKNNYRHTLTRESLSEIVGFNPNYLKDQSSLD